jgi:carbonic anhydrase/acetyltransferase-like protein (isoleucine patch superfamily)
VALYAIGDLAPTIHPDAFVHPDAVVIGDVRIGAEATVWPGTVLRGDESHIEVGARTSIQDGSVIHCTSHLPTVVRADAAVGHMVHLEGCLVESFALVGNGAVVLHRAVISTGAIVGSNAVVTNKMVVPPGALALGVPAKVREGAADRALIEGTVASYVAKGHRYRDELRRLD